MKTPLPIAAFVLMMTCFSCTSKKQSASQPSSPTPAVVAVAEKINVDTALNNFYSILSGQFSAKASSVLSKSDEALYASGKSSYDKLWNRMDSFLLHPIELWSPKELPKEFVDHSFLFYPFSGPDFLIPNALSKNIKTTIMFGLEETGTDISFKGNHHAVELMPTVQKSLHDYIDKSYFITGNMIKDFKQAALKGITPVLATFIVRSGYQLLSIKNFYLDSAGAEVYIKKDSANQSALKKQKVEGVKINYTTDGTQLCTVTYLSFNAEDANLQQLPRVTTYLQAAVPQNCNTYLKSASYLLHYEQFSTVRNICLKKSRYILQDDTGISIKYFDQNWTLTLWGNYEKPIREFSNVYQGALDSLYKIKAPIKALPFSMGYHYYTGKQNLMLAKLAK